MSQMIRTYSELITIPNYVDRFNYLSIKNQIGQETFGVERYLNQKFYQHDPEWLSVRDYVISRDYARDLGCEGYEIPDDVIIIVHHMNPITAYDITYRTDKLLNPEYLITTIDRTHKAIHYGSELSLIALPPERTLYDTCPWRRKGDY